MYFDLGSAVRLKKRFLSIPGRVCVDGLQCNERALKFMGMLGEESFIQSLV